MPALLVTVPACLPKHAWCAGAHPAVAGAINRPNALFYPPLQRGCAA